MRQIFGTLQTIGYRKAAALLLAATLSVTACRKGEKPPAGINAKAAVPAAAIREEVGPLPDTVRSPPGNPGTPQKIELGRLLFYDPILSGQKDVSCASCHHPNYGYAESQEISIGVNGLGLGEMRTFRDPGKEVFARRNAHTLLNTAFNGMDADGNYDPEKAPMFWDLRVESLEKQSLEPIKNLEEMRGHAYDSEVTIDSVVHRLQAIAAYERLFQEVFGGSRAISAVNVSKALAAFERSLVANNSRFDRYMKGEVEALSALEKEGFASFMKAGCAKCHNGPMFSDYKLHVLGVAENEKLKQPDAGANNTHAYRTPTLRNLRYTDPYMHSGKLATIRSVLQFYEDMMGKQPPNPLLTREDLDPLIKDLKVDFKDIQAIEAFLNALNDDNFDRKIPTRVPSGLPVGGNIQ